MHRIENLVKFAHMVFTARRYASAVLAVVMCLSVCLSHAGIVSKRLNVGSRKQRRMIAHGLWFSDAEDLGEIQMGSPATGAPSAGVVG